MTWKDVLKFDRAKMRQRAEREEKEIDDLSPHQYSGAKKDQMSLLASIKRTEEEQDHLDSRKDKRRKMGLKGNESFPRKRRKHRGGRGRLGDTKLLPIPKGKRGN
jgi:hypothetical protein|tara:strand:+ start:53 stop:367 length:315 start_codon:yes stop_codon:yes gene_type:complete